MLTAVDGEDALLAVDAAQTLAHIVKAGVGRIVWVLEFAQHLRWEAVSPIAHADVGALVILTDADVHAPVVHRHKAVAHGVFHNGLENERWQAQLCQVIGQRAFDVQLALKACLGEHKVVVHIRDLLLKGDKGIVDGQRLAEIGGEDKYRFTGAVGIGQAQTGDGVERVEQKVRVDLCLK